MDNFQLIKASSPGQFKIISEIAQEIWREHFINIIGKSQVEYMLTRFQSVPAITKAVLDGYQYYILNDGSIHAGYFAIQARDDGMFLSKIYIKQQHRGKKMATHALKFIEKRARELGLTRIYLTCNVRNYSAIVAYEKMGFKKTKHEITDIGENFKTDDWVMEKKLTAF